MKNFVLLLLLLLSIGVLSFSQGKKNTSYYLNNKKIDIDNVFINSNNIDSIWTEKSLKGGEIYLHSKKNIEFVSLNNIIEPYEELDNKDESLVYFVNNKLIKSKPEVIIDDSFFVEVKIDKLENVSYIEKKYTSLYIVNILLNEEDLIYLK